MQNEPLMSIRQVTDYLQLNQTTVYAWAQQGILPGFKLGRRWRFRPSEIEAWLEAQRQPRRDSSSEGAGQPSDAPRRVE